MLRLIILFFLKCTVAFDLATKVRVQSNNSIQVIRPEQPSSPLRPDISLESYMTLPVEQYVLVPMPLNAKLSRQDDEFLLIVPPMNFFNLQVQPIVTASVILEPNQVVISSKKCRLNSPTGESSYIEKVRLNDRFQFYASCTLSWDTENIFASTKIKVDVDPPRPFDKLPRKLLETTGNTAMRLSMNYIIRSFLKGLSQDFYRWSEDEEYREQRGALSFVNSTQI